MSDTYYAKNRDARIAYQKEYYLKKRGEILRRIQVKRELDEDFCKKQREYQNEYYRKNSEKLKEKRRKKYAEKKQAASRTTVEESGHNPSDS